MAETIGILLQLILDKAKSDQVKKETAEVAEMFEYMAKNAGYTDKEIKELTKDIEKFSRSLIVSEKELERANEELEITKKKVGDLNQISASLGQVSQGLFLAGSAIVGSIYASANAEAQRIKEAGGVVDETTQKWLTAQERIKVSYQRIGRVAESAILPLLEKVAAIAEKGSKFVEQNPGIVQAALRIGSVVATLGAVGMLVSKGVRFFADVTMISAQLKYAASTAVFKSSVDKFIGGVAKQSMGGTGTAGVGGLAGKACAALGTVTLIATSVIIGAEIGKALGNTIAKAIYGAGYKEQSLGDAARTAYRTASLPGQMIAVQLKELGVISDETAAKIANFVKGTDEFIGKVFDGENALEGLTDGLDEMADSAKKAEAEAKGMEILGNLQRENAEAEREYQQERAAIMREATNALNDANRDLSRETDKIKATLKETLGNLAADFAAANQQATIDYQNQYAEIVSSGEEEILQIKKDAAEQLRELEKQHAQEVDDATRTRDALALAKADRDYEDQKKEIIRKRDEEIAESRRQTKIRLQELKQSFEQERAERLAKYQQDVLDAKAKAEQEKAEAEAAFQERQAEILRQRAQELAELQRKHAEERRKRVLAAAEQIRDLGGALEAERALRQRYYQIFAEEAKAALDSIRSAGGGSTVSGTARSGGGGRALSGVGSALSSLINTQSSERAALAGATIGGGQSLTLNDSRRIDYSIPIEERRALENEMVQKALTVFSGLLGGRKR